MGGKQLVRKGIWHIGGKYKRAPKRRHKAVAIPLGLLASIGAPILGEIAITNARKNTRKRNKKEKKQKNKEILKWSKKT